MGTLLLRFQTIKTWAAEFKRGRTGLEDDPREGRPKSATTPEIVEQVHDMVLDDRRISTIKHILLYNTFNSTVNCITSQPKKKKKCEVIHPVLLT